MSTTQFNNLKNISEGTDGPAKDMATKMSFIVNVVAEQNKIIKDRNVTIHNLEETIEDKNLTIHKLEERVKDLENELKELKPKNEKYVLIVECNCEGDDDIKTIVLEFANDELFEMCDENDYKNIQNQVQHYLDDHYKECYINGRMIIEFPADDDQKLDLYIKNID